MAIPNCNWQSRYWKIKIRQSGLSRVPVSPRIEQAIKVLVSFAFAGGLEPLGLENTVL